MVAIELTATKRSVIGKQVSALRARGLVPAVVYGHGLSTETIEVPVREIERVYAQAGGNKIVALKVGSAKPRNVLFHEVQTDVLRGGLRHVDFYAVRMNEKLTAEVPLHYVGESDAVYKDQGTLVKQMEVVEVECLPGDLPESIEVDIAVLTDFEKTITLADLELPKGVQFADSSKDLTQQLVAKVEPPRTEAQMAELEESVTTELPEVVTEEGTTAQE
jgi:large subunit ribosomal protein L25